jgi:parallel beta-helix repeat protein
MYTSLYISDITDSTVPDSTSLFTDIESRRNVDADNRYSRKLEFWFVAPQSANYTFHASCDDYCSVSIARTAMSTTTDYSFGAGYNSFRNFWNPYPTLIGSSISSEQIELVAGEHYFMRVWHQDSGHSEHVTVGFTIEDESTLHQNSQLGWKRLRIDGDNTFEKFEISIPQTEDQDFKIGFDTCSSFTSTVAWSDAIDDITCIGGAFSRTSTAGTVKVAIRDYLNIKKSNYGYYLDVEKFTLDASDVHTDVEADMVKTKFIITGRYATSSPIVTTFNIISETGTTSASIVRVQNSTVPLDGSFRIKYGSTYTSDINIDSADGHMLRYFYQANPQLIGQYEFRRDYNTFLSGNEGFDLYYRTSNRDNEDLEIVAGSTTTVTGGGTVSYDSTHVAVAKSNKPFYPAIPGWMVRTVETSPQIIVTANGIRGACPEIGTCDVQFVTSSAEITGFTVIGTNDGLLFTGTSIPSDDLTYVDIEGGRKCIISTATAPTATGFSCFIEAIAAGDYTVRVQTSSGALPNAGSVTDFSVNIEINGASPSTLYSTGGQTVTIAGDYFPATATEAFSYDDFSVEFTGSLACTVTSVSQTQITCIAPSGLSGSPTLTVAFNGKTHTHSTPFTVSVVANTVDSINKPVLCPVEKQDVVITISDFMNGDSVADNYRGLLISDGYEIYLRINEINASTKELTARFPGAPRFDTWTLHIEYKVDDTTYARFVSDITVSTEASISAVAITTSGDPKVGVSTTGGDLITITGQGFSTDSDNHIVLFGGANIATIVSTSATQIVVRAPASETDGTQEIKVYLKPNLLSNCASTCEVTYDSTQAGTVDLEEVTAVEGAVTITGTGFGDNPVGYIDGFMQETVGSPSATEVMIRLTNYNDPLKIDLEVRTDTINLPKVTVTTPLTEAINSVTPNSGSEGGELLKFDVTGVGLETTSNLKVFYGSGSSAVEICDEIKLVSSSTITCKTKEMTITSNTLKISYSYKDSISGTFFTKTIQCATSSDCTYATSGSMTPNIVSISYPTATTIIIEVDADWVGANAISEYAPKVFYGAQMSDSESTITNGSGNFEITGTFSNGYLKSNADVYASFDRNGMITYSETTQAAQTTTLTVSTTSTCSWAGGCEFSVQGAGIKGGAEVGDVLVTVCGLKAELVLDSSTTDELKVRAPVYATTHSLENFNVEDSHNIEDMVTVTSLPANLGLRAFDGTSLTQFTSASTNNCYVQAAFESGKVGRLEKIRFFMKKMADKSINFVGKLKFQESSDATTWTDVYTATVSLREGWNEITPASALTSQYYRFFAANKEACQVAEVEFIGNVVENTSATSKACAVEVTLAGSAAESFADRVTYTDAATPVVSAISQRYGTYLGGDSLTITGTGFSTVTSEVHVTIDGIECSVTSATATSIQCTTGARPTVVEDGMTELRFSGSTPNGYAAMQDYQFSYANYWSDLETWGGEYLPKEGDSIVIPKGQTLIVDIDRSPILYAVLVEGALVFQPDADSNHERFFDAEYIFISMHALMEVGTPENRYTSKLTITMHGTRESPQIPTYGNKGIFVRHGQLDIHGAERTPTWTELDSTIQAGGTQITTVEETDWKVGEKIVIAPTDFEVDNAEEFTISAITNSGGKSIITLSRPTIFKHYAGSVDYTGSNFNGGTKTKTLEMRAEVGLLSRNVVYKGADDDSVEAQYGAHIMMHSHGDDSLTGRISYVELTQVGQAFQLGRYPIHFHMIGNVHNSYVKGNAIHHTYNRACTIHGVHYLTIKDNVAYHTMGHTFFIEDAVETKNTIEHNLAIRTKRSWSLLNTDQTPASFWITNPDNILIGNHAAGSDRYGFWFDLQQHSTGPSEDLSICPEFMELGEFTGNVAHSNGRYGLRIFHRMTPSTDPCAALASEKHLEKEMPDTETSQPVLTHIRDFVGYKNKITGLIASEIGEIKFHNIRVADNLHSGVEFTVTSTGPWLTTDDDYHLQDSLIVGYTAGNGEEVQKETVHRGLKGSQTEKMRVKDTLFVNFDESEIWAAIGTCSHCEGPGTDSSGRTYFFKELYFGSNTTQKVKFDTPFKEIIYDEDGSLTESNTHRWVVRNFKHLMVDECTEQISTHDGLICSNDIKIRRIVFHHGEPYNNMKYLPIKIINLSILPTVRNRRSLSTLTCPTDASTIAELDSDDTAALANQALLMAEYEPFNAAWGEFKEVYDARSDCGCDYECPFDAAIDYCADSFNDNSVDSLDTCTCGTICSFYLCKQKVYEEAKADIAVFVNQRTADSGAFDKLYSTDATFCDPENYQNIDFRFKINPKKNWVFPVVSGYEYKVHFAQGADFDSLNGEYSYNELLNGETDGVVVHFNHTERAEAFYFDYVNSTDGAAIRTETQSIKLSASPTSVMGDFFMNNVTRHASLKFDGQNPDAIRFTLARDECITIGGCNGNNQITDEEIETTPRYWSVEASWEGRGIPQEGEDVLIDNTWNMVLDIPETPILRSLEINGRLTVKNNATSYKLQSYLIYVRKGELIIGTEESPHLGNVEIVLYGDRSDKDIYFNENMFEGGNKGIAVTGKLRMYGQPVGTKWTRLATTAEAAQPTLELIEEPVGWAVGDLLGIAPSGRDWEQRDWCTISALSGSTVTCAANLSYQHYGAASIDSSASGNIDIRTEVVHLTRNVKVVGYNEDKWGAQIVTGRNNDTQIVAGQLQTVELTGHTIIDNVEFYNCSQYDTDKAAVRFDNLAEYTEEDIRSKVTNSAIHSGHGIGIMVKNSEDVIVDNNVVFFQHIGGIWMKKSNNITITNNVVAGMGTRYWSGETRLDEIAGYNLCNKDQNCADLILQNNIMAGGQRIGFLLPTVACGDMESYSGNMAHSVQHGAWLLRNTLLTGCEGFYNFQVYKTMEQGVFAYQGFDTELKVANIETLDCGRGVTLMIGQESEGNFIHFDDSVVMGESLELPQDSGNYCVELHGYWLSAASRGGKVVPESKLSNLPYEKIKSYATWYTEAYSRNVTFKNWRSETRTNCASASTNDQKIFFINRDNSDHVAVQTFTNTVFDNVISNAVAQLDDPNQAWSTINDCGSFPCTAPDNAIIKFIDASATGDNIPDYISSIESGTSFQILSNNIGVTANIDNCQFIFDWNAYLCRNDQLGQLVFESLDGDVEDRTFSPIQYRGEGDYSAFNNTLNSFMDHCWDGHYTCQKRLSRFPGMLQLNRAYEIWFTGTQPGNSRYTIEGASEATDYLILKIDFSKSIVYNVYADGTQVESYFYNDTLRDVPTITQTHCGENRFEESTYTYEFYLTRNCTVTLKAQDHLYGVIRLQMTVDQFFEEDFRNSLAYNLGITTDKIKVVGAKTGSVIVSFYLTSGQTTTTTRQKQLAELADQLASQHAAGTLTVSGYSVLDLVTQLVTEDGQTITTGTGTYDKKEIHASVYVLIAISAIAVFVGLLIGVYKAVKTAKVYKEVANIDTSIYEKGDNKSELPDEIEIKEKRGENQIGIREEEKAN